MIAERRSVLLKAAGSWHESPACSPPISAPSISVTPLSERLSALKTSSSCWRNRVRDEGADLAKVTPRRDQTNSVASNKPGTPSLPPSKRLTFSTPDAGLRSFFTPLRRQPESLLTPNEEVQPVDLDAVHRTQNYLKFPSRPKLPYRKRTRTTRSLHLDQPAIALEASLDELGPEITERREGNTERDNDRGPLAKSARDALQAVEDYSEAKGGLKQCDDSSPFPPVMLIRVKGDRRCDVRLVCPSAESIDSLASFLLVTRNRCLLYHGTLSNIYERTKATQLGIEITSRKELHCAAEVLERASPGESAHAAFYIIIGNGGGQRKETAQEYLEAFENFAAKSNLFLSVTENFKCLILDFGSEIYVWSGRNVKKSVSKCAADYAQQLKDKHGVPNSRSILGTKELDERPQWTVIRCLSQGMLDVLFQAKFIDWPVREKGVTLACLGTPSANSSNRTAAKRSSVSPRVVLQCDTEEVGTRLSTISAEDEVLQLEDLNISGREREIITEKRTFWKLTHEHLHLMPETNTLFTDSCYVVKWEYRHQKMGVHLLRDGRTRDAVTGRSRVAYFYWLGEDVTKKDAGVVALNLDLMDEEKKQHVRLEQGREPLAFMSLVMRGTLIIRRRDSPNDSLFLIQGAHGCSKAVQLLPETQAGKWTLRSHAVYIRIHTKNSHMIAGSDCRMDDVRAALHLSDYLLEDNQELPRTYEGEDSSLRWISAVPSDSSPRFYRILAEESDEIRPVITGFSFPMSQSVLEDTVLITCGSLFWLWSDGAPTTVALKIASVFADARCTSEGWSVRKGAEPAAFQALFPTWTEWEESDRPEMHSEKQIKVGKRIIDVPESVQRFTELLSARQRKFPLAALRAKTDLPEGMEMNELDQYLEDSDFELVFKMNRSQFSQLPQWKQIRLRQEAELF